jgi:hypothetical protein
MKWPGGVLLTSAMDDLKGQDLFSSAETVEPTDGGIDESRVPCERDEETHHDRTAEHEPYSDHKGLSKPASPRAANVPAKAKRIARLRQSMRFMVRLLPWIVIVVLASIVAYDFVSGLLIAPPRIARRISRHTSLRYPLLRPLLILEDPSTAYHL